MDYESIVFYGGGIARRVWVCLGEGYFYSILLYCRVCGGCRFCWVCSVRVIVVLFRGFL